MTTAIALLVTIPYYTATLLPNDYLRFLPTANTLSLQYDKLWSEPWRLITSSLLVAPLHAPYLIQAAASFGLLFTFLPAYERTLNDAATAVLISQTVFAHLCILVLTRAFSLPNADAFTHSALLFFFIFLYGHTEPAAPLNGSTVVQRWHSPYVVLLFVLLIQTPFLTWENAVCGIAIGVLYRLATVSIPNNYGFALWAVPDALVTFTKARGWYGAAQQWRYAHNGQTTL